MKKRYIYRVNFKEAVNGKKNHYFTSISAIYTKFTPDQIGCKVQNLWNLKLADGVPYNGRRCQITKEEVTSKKQENGNNFRS